MKNMDLEKSIILAIEGDAILFLGAGASKGAENQNEEELVTGSELAKRIWNNCDDLQQSVDLFLDAKKELGLDSQSELIDFLKNEFRVKRLSDYQKMIPDIPWKRIYTTNYDNVVEKAYYNKSKGLKSVTSSNKPKQAIASDDLLCFHINGSINNLSKETLNSEFKLSDVSYNTDDFSNSDWGHLFRTDLKTYSVVIFIGFSMRYDLDIRRLVNEISKNKCVFIVSKNEKQDNINYLKKYGFVENIGLDGFFDKYNEICKSYIPIPKTTIDNSLLTNFENKNRNCVALHEPKDSDVLNYYIRSQRVPELYHLSNENYKAIVKRNVIDKIIHDIKNGIKAIFIHSDIGNGKTEVIEQLCIELPKEYRKYLLIENNEKIAKEIELICQSNYQNIIIIENFFNYYEAYKLFKLFNNKDNIIFIFTARTSIYRNRYEAFVTDTMSVYDLNRLNQEEITSLINIFTEYGYYLNNYNDSKMDMQRFVKKDCNSKLQPIILMMFNNIAIVNSLNLLTDELLNKKNPNYHLVLFPIIIKIMALDLNFEDVLNLLNMNTISYNFEKNHNVNELIELHENRGSIKSAALCVWILRNKNLMPDIIDMLIKAAIKADIGYEIDIKYKQFLGNIISFRHLKFIFDIVQMSNINKLNWINFFYQSLKNLNYYKDKYYFWLQYGISALELNDYEGSEMHFKAAYNKIPENMQPFEIDNHYARLKLEVILLDNYTYNSMTFSEFCQIDKLLTPTNAEADDKYYCFKMSSSYYRKFFDKFYTLMQEHEKEGIKGIAKSNFNDCDSYIKKNKNVNFSDKLLEFKNEFLKLAFYESDDMIDFTALQIKKYYVRGTFLQNNQPKNASIHISQISENYVNNISEYISEGQIVKAKKIKYNAKRKSWELSLKHVSTV